MISSSMNRLSGLLLLAAFAACGQKSSLPPPAAPQPASQPSAPAAKPPPPPPANVPKDFAAKIEQAWPGLEKRAEEGKRHFDAAVKAKNAGDRATLKAEVDAGGKIYSGLIDEWAELTYTIEDLPDQRQKDVCWQWIASKEKVAKGWRDRAQALKNLSTN